MPMTFTIIQSHVQYKLFSQVEAYKVIFAVTVFKTAIVVITLFLVFSGGVQSTLCHAVWLTSML